MFNENIKRQFIDYYLSSKYIAKTAVENIFRCSEKLEELADNRKGKDICNFTKTEIEEYYICLQAKSKERISVTNSILKEYKIWAIDVGICYDDTPYFDTFTIKDFKRFISKNVLENKYIGEETLKSYLNEIINPCDQLLLVLLYNGIKGKQLSEIIDLHINQVDGNVLHLSSGRSVEVDSSIINLIEETNNTYVYYTYGENTKKFELSGEKVFKDTKGVRSDSMNSIYHRYTSKMVVFQKMFDNPELAINRIGLSGMLNTLIKSSKEKNMALAEFVSSDMAKPILERFKCNRHPSKVMKIFEEYLDYIH